MANFVELNPQPEPPCPALIIIGGILEETTQTVTLGWVTPGGFVVIEIDPNTHKVTRELKVPEKGGLRFRSAAKAVGAAINTWNDAKDVKGLEQVRTQAEQLLVRSVEAVLKVVAGT